MMAAASVVVLSCLLATLVARRVWPAITLPVAFITSALILLAAAISTGALGALLIALAFISVTLLLGDAVLQQLPKIPAPPILRLPLATALGLGLLGMLLFALGAFSALNAATVFGATGLLLVGLFIHDRHRLLATLGQVRAWRPVTPCWFETIVVALGTGILTYALLAAFVPEVMGNASDVMRQHLPVAREIWQTGSIPNFSQLFASNQPIQGHLYYAVAYGLGGASAGKLLQALIGLAAIAGVAAIGWLGGGRIAAVASGTIFATIPIALWNVGHLYPDVIAILFTVTAAICIVLWQQDARVVWLVVAGALVGIGFATKVATILFVIAFGMGVFLVGRSPWRWRERVLAALAYGAGTLVAVPWLVRSYLLLGSSFSELAKLNRLSGTGGGSSPDAGAASTLVPGGVGLAPLDLLLGPWTLTFDGAPRNYRAIMNGEFGIALLMLLPLAFLRPYTRAKVFLALVVAVSYLGWTFSGQVSRHLLATLALAAAIAGIGVSQAVTATRNRPIPVMGMAARTGLVTSCLAALLFFLPNHTTRLPVDLLLGRQTAAEYVEQEIWALTALNAASELLPPDTRVGYIGLWEGPQAYTEARLVFLGNYSPDDSNFLDNQLGSTPEAVLARLDALGLKYFIWDRPNTRIEDWNSALLSGDLLREHARILAGDGDAYLFEVLPGGGQTWGMDHPVNLLQDPRFRQIRRKNGPWTTTGKISKVDGALTLRGGATIEQQVPVTGGEPYLLLASIRCPEPALRTMLTLRWLDSDGATISVAAENVHPGVEVSDQFLWRQAPEQAAFASVELGGGGGARCEYSEIGLFAAPRQPGSAE
jgi:4-amino-4-deoxy-L-arabinose transferase-like glycosyltransferase